MSTLLEQAIVDAEALKEAAMKNAEASIIEKYSSEVRAAVDSLLEQEEETLEEESDESPVMDEVPYAVEEGDEPIMVRLDLEALERALDEEQEVVEETHEELADNLEEEIEGALETEGVEGSEEDLDISEDLINALAEELAEELTVDLTVPDQGLGGRSTPTARNLQGQEVQLAAIKDDELAEEHEALEKAREEAGMFAEQIEALTSEKSNLEKTVLHLKGRLEEINLSNARLLYTNRVLNSTSLNERQKTRIVESISNADSVEEAKVIYETLQSAVGEVRNNKSPQSLREAVQRPSPTLPRKRGAKAQSPHFDRMRALAGINIKGDN
jgi:hypothetical protein|tara:strand:- start:945 stop:1928 length:984 start_codon:yes stop_codon:yes gene_type:complete